MFVFVWLRDAMYSRTCGNMRHVCCSLHSVCFTLHTRFQRLRLGLGGVVVRSQQRCFVHMISCATLSNAYRTFIISPANEQLGMRWRQIGHAVATYTHTHTARNSASAQCLVAGCDFHCGPRCRCPFLSAPLAWSIIFRHSSVLFVWCFCCGRHERSSVPPVRPYTSFATYETGSRTAMT